MKYSVLSYNISGYEIIHPIREKSENAEYIMVTDDRSLTSDDWNIVYVDNPYPEDPFRLVFEIRYNPFKYVHTDIVMKIDGSMEITGDIDRIVDRFIEGGYDCAVMAHPTRMNMYDEYMAWIRYRGYPKRQAERALTFMNVEGYDVKKNTGLYQYNWMIQRNNKLNDSWNTMTMGILKYLAPEGKLVDRLDQTIGSYVLNKYFEYASVMCVSQRIATSGKYFVWHPHKSLSIYRDSKDLCSPFLLGKQVIPFSDF